MFENCKCPLMALAVFKPTLLKSDCYCMNPCIVRRFHASRQLICFFRVHIIVCVP